MIWALGLGLTALPATVLAGAWPQDAGTGQAIIIATRNGAERGFDASGHLNQDILYDKDEISLFAEYGLSDRVTLVGRAAWQDVLIDGPAGRQQKAGLAASEFGARMMLSDGERGVLAAQVVMLAPGAAENVSDLDLGDGGWGYEGRLLYGRGFSFSGGEAFLEGQAAWRWQSGPSPDEARMDLTLGWSKGRWLIMTQAFGLHATGARAPRRNYDSLKLQTSVTQRITSDTRIQMGAFRTMAGRAIVRETGWFVALWRDF